MSSYIINIIPVYNSHRFLIIIIDCCRIWFYFIVNIVNKTYIHTSSNSSFIGDIRRIINEFFNYFHTWEKLVAVKFKSWGINNAFVPIRINIISGVCYDRIFRFVFLIVAAA